MQKQKTRYIKLYKINIGKMHIEKTKQTWKDNAIFPKTTLFAKET